MSIEIKATKIEIVDIDSIHPWEENANKHSKEQILELIEQFKFNGMRTALEVEVGTNDIVVGCGRWMAAKKIGMKKVPVIYATYDSYSHKYVRMTSDNGLGKQSELDLGKIHLNLSNLHLDDIKLLGIAGFEFEPIFGPGSADEQGKLDEKQLKFVTCPHCEKEFELGQAKVRTQD